MYWPVREPLRYSVAETVHGQPHAKSLLIHSRERRGVESNGNEWEGEILEFWLWTHAYAVEQKSNEMEILEL